MRKDNGRGPKESCEARRKPLKGSHELVVRETEKGWQRFKECRSARVGHAAVWRRTTSRAPRPSAPASALQPTTTAAALWGTVLPIPAGAGAGDDFEARVQRAWGYIKAAHFAPAEHERLRETLAGVIADEIAGRKHTPSTTTP